MTGYRQLHTRMWSSDTWFSALKPDMKLLFIYLFSNERTSVCGLYEIPIRTMSVETGLDRSQIENALKFFDAADKAKYDFEKGVVWVKNMWKYQGSSSPKLAARIKADIETVPACDLKTDAIQWLSRHTVSIGYRNGSDTPLSVSISDHVHDLEEEGVQGEGKPPGDLRTFERIWQQATGMATFLGGSREQDIPRIEAIFARNGRDFEKTQAELRRYFNAWCNTISPKTKRKYSRSNSGWLDWAVAGEVPASSNGKKPKTEYDYEALKKIAQKEGL